MLQSPSVVPWPMAVPRGDLGGGLQKGLEPKEFFFFGYFLFSQ